MSLALKTTPNKAVPVLAIFLNKLGWWLVFALLIILPFQSLIQNRLDIPFRFTWIDEVFILLCCTLSFLYILYSGKMKVACGQILATLLLVVFIGFLSVCHNSVSHKIGIGAIFNYIKNFLPIVFFSAFFIPKNKFVLLFNILKGVAIGLCTFAIFQEVVFLLGLPVEKLILPDEYTYTFNRYGFFRTPSLMWHPNELGIYALLFFVLNYSLTRRLQWQNIILLSGVFLSGARTVWAALFLALFYLLIQKNKKFVGVFFVVFIIAVSILVPRAITADEVTSENYFRKYTILKSLEIWQDHPLLGVGPGMYGGWTSIGFDSTVFQAYGFEQRWIEAIERSKTLDSFWFANLAEVGLLGTISFIILFIVLWYVAINNAKMTHDLYINRLLIGFSAIPIITTCFLLTQALNVTSSLLTYGILFGMILGAKDDESPTRQ